MQSQSGNTDKWQNQILEPVSVLNTWKKPMLLYVEFYWSFCKSSKVFSDSISKVPKQTIKLSVLYKKYRWTVSNIKSVPFVHKWTISASGITINYPVATLMGTFVNKNYNHGIVKCNPWCTYSPLVPKRDTFMLL